MHQTQEITPKLFAQIYSQVHLVKHFYSQRFGRMPRNGLGLHGEGFGSAELYRELWGGGGRVQLYSLYWHMASVAMARFTIVPLVASNSN